MPSSERRGIDELSAFSFLGFEFRGFGKPSLRSERSVRLASSFVRTSDDELQV